MVIKIRVESGSGDMSGWEIFEIQRPEGDAAVFEAVIALSDTMQAQGIAIDRVSERVDEVDSRMQAAIAEAEKRCIERMEQLRQDRQGATQTVQGRIQNIEGAAIGNTPAGEYSTCPLDGIIPGVCSLACKVYGAVRFFF